MILSNFTQFNLLLYSFLAGIITGMLFDAYRVIRGLKTPNKYISFFEDILFWIFTAIVIFVFLLYNNDGIMNFYVYLFIGIGIYMYMKLLSKHLIKMEINILRCILRVIRIIFNTITYPLRLLIYKIFNK